MRGNRTRLVLWALCASLAAACGGGGTGARDRDARAAGGDTGTDAGGTIADGGRETAGGHDGGSGDDGAGADLRDVGVDDSARDESDTEDTAAPLPDALGADTPVMPAPKPNVVVILADDLGFADLGVQGSPDIPTPHIDSIAAAGVRFTRGYVSGPYCSPTRAALLTGRYQTRFGHEFNEGRMSNRPIFGLPVGEITFAHRMKALGYATAVVGKWHLGYEDKFRPTRRGFDEFYGTLGNTPFFNPEIVDSRVGQQPRKIDDPKFYTTFAFADRAIDIIEQRKAQPFFLYLAFNAVHAPNQAPAEYLNRFNNITNDRRRSYAAMTAALDDAVGRVLAKLRAEGLEERTLIFFLSDNGGPMTRWSPNGSSNRPLRGQKGDVWEGGIHVPFFVQWKGRLPAGMIFDRPVSQIDILPTAIAAAGGQPAPDWKLDGVNLLPFIGGQETGEPHDMLFWRFGTQRAVIDSPWKLVRGFDDSGSQGDVQPPLAQTTPWQLYNLTDDPSEKRDVAATQSARARALETAWTAWDKDNVPPAWIP